MKTILLVAGLFIAITAGAQQAAVDKMTQALTDSLAYLQLTDQQTATAKQLNATAATGLLQTAQKAKQDTSFKGKALFQQVMGIFKTRNTGLKKILTADQMKLYNAHQVQQMAELQTRMMTAQLNLGDEQVPQVYDVNLKWAGEMMENMDDMKDAKRKMARMRAARAMKSDSKDKDKALKKILSADQYAKYEKQKEEMQAAMKQKMQEKKNAAS